MPQFRQRVCCLLGLFALLSPSLRAAEVGTTAGAFAVSPSGAATYSIPITVPPGAGGMQPQLSIDYNSQGGDGPLGIGFSLSGLSAITRCPTTLDQDGFIDGVDFDTNDRFCLDGQRLIAISGSYGAVGAEYRTELESFSKVVSYGGSIGDPAYFKVWTKAGLLMEFGATADSRTEAQGRSQALIWTLNKVSDSAGNYFTVSYSENSSTGESLPTGFQYTGNANASVAPAAAVQFQYESRPDTRSGYLSGSLVSQTQRLTRVLARNYGALVREYRLVYDQGGQMGGSRLASIQECGTADCLPATTLSWPSTPSGSFVSRTNTVNGNWGSSGFTWTGDFNGDGKSDIATASAATVRVELAADDGFLSQDWPVTNQWEGGSGGYTWQGDFDGNGRTDIASAYGGTVYMKLSSGAGFTSAAWPVADAWGGPEYTWVGDFDGDGRNDIASASGANVYLKLSTGNGFASATWPVTNAWADSGYTWVGDFNGDGLTDIASANAGAVHVKLSTGTGFVSQDWLVANQWGGGAYTKTGDFNGDGLTDIASAYGGNVFMKLSTGSGFVSATWPVANAWGDSGYTWAADFNNDGRIDIASASAGSIFLKFSTGRSFTSVTWQAANAWGSPEYTRVGDFNGDGLSDIGSAYGGSIYVKSAVGYRDLVASVTNGLGAAVGVIYKPLSNSDSYGKYSGAPYPAMDLNGPIYAVAEFSTPNGGGGFNRQSYRYEGLRTSLRGRGLLGFARQTVTNEVTGIKEITDYGQDFPFIGAPIKTVTITSSGLTVSESEITYDKVTLGSGGAATQFVFAKKTINRGWDIASYNRAITSQVVENEYGESPTHATFFGNLTRSVASTYAGPESGAVPFATVTANAYSNNASLWHLGRLTRSQVTRSGPSIASATRTSAFEYNAQTGLLSAEIVEPDYVDFRLRTSYARDSFGNITATTASGSGVATRTTSQEFDPTGRFNTRTINPLGHSESRSYDPATGNVLSRTSPNGLVTYFQYDAFGRPIGQSFSQHGVSTSKSSERRWCTGSGLCQSGEVLYVRSYDSAGADGYVFFDLLEREVRSTAKSGNGQWLEVLTQYNDRGQVLRKSSPRFQGGALYWATYSYDAIGRALTESAPSPSGYSRDTTFTYNGLVTQQNVEGQITTRETSVLGKPLAVTDNRGGRVTYAYDAFDNLISTRDADGNVTTLAYDLRGRKTEMVEPNMGRWTYFYNVLGELTRQQDAKGQVVNMTYDLLGRMTQRTEAEGSTAWNYDSLWKGALTSVTSPGYARDYEYYPFGAVKAEHVSIAAATPPDAPPPDGPAAVLQVNQPVANLSGNTGDERRFTFTVPSGATGLKIYLSGGAGDADLYVKLGSDPTTSSYHCRSIASNNNDTCDLGNAAPGTYHILVRGYSAYTGATLVGTYSYTPGGVPLPNGQPTVLFGSAGAELRFAFSVPAGSADVTFAISGGSGNADLYVKRGAEPTLASYDCRSAGSGSQETCSLGDSATAATYYVLVHGAGAFSSASLSASYSAGLTSGTAQPVPASTSGTELRYSFVVPSGATNLKFSLSGGTGNADLYVRRQSLPPPAYDCYPTSEGNNELCDFGNAPPGRYHLLVRGGAAFSGVSILASYDYVPGGRSLSNFVPAYGQHGWKDAELRYQFSVPAGAQQIRFAAEPGTGNVDLYVSRAVEPTVASYDCRSTNPAGSGDSCTFAAATAATTYYLLVHGAEHFTNVNVVASYAHNGNTTVLQDGVPVTGIAGYSDTQWLYTFEVPAGASSVSFSTSGGSGDSALYVRYNAAPTTTAFDCKSDQSGNQAACDSTTLYNGQATLVIAPLNGVPPPGRYHVMIRGNTSFSGVTLTARYSRAPIPPLDPPPVNPPPVDPSVVTDTLTAILEWVESPPDVPDVHCVKLVPMSVCSRVEQVEEIIGDVIGSLPIPDPSAIPDPSDCRWRLGALTVINPACHAVLSPSDIPLPFAAPPTPDNTTKEFVETLAGFFGTSTTFNGTGSGQMQGAAAPATQTRSISYAYDSQGRVAEISYPSGFKVRHGYNANGALSTVTNVSSGLIYWQAQDWDQWGLSSSRLGNGIVTTALHAPGAGVLTDLITGPNGSGTVQRLNYAWDDHGNLTARKDLRQNIQETFSYDGLNRLTGNALYGVPELAAGASTLALTYSATGNITSKSGTNYSYGAKPHAVSAAGGFSYDYDTNGNLTAGAGRSYVWTSYNLPSRISEGDSATDFLYGPERQRIRQSSSSATRGGRLSYFFHALYEEQAYSSYTEQKHHINTPQGVVAIETKGPTNKTEYLHRDHLGSVDAITNAAGQVTQRLSFDAFGKRRGENWEVKTFQTTYLTNWGYTGHQQQDDLGLIHMNGRVYDPALGRFISADPFIQDALNTQNYNRYSYVVNNPLRYTDPSGYLFGIGRKVKRELGRVERDIRHEFRRSSLFQGIAHAAVAVGSAFCGPAAAACFAAGEAGVARAAGVESGRALLRIGVISGVTYAVGARVPGGRVVGGAINGFIQTGDLNGALRGAAAGLIPQDLGLGYLGIDAYYTNPYANVGIGIVRDGTRGVIVADSRSGFGRGVAIGQANNAVGHLIGFATTGSGPVFYDGHFVYAGGYAETVYGDRGAVAVGNVIAGTPQMFNYRYGYFGTYDHELEHIYNPIEQSLGVMYVPLHILELGLGRALFEMGYGCSGYVFEEHTNYYPYSTMGNC